MTLLDQLKAQHISDHNEPLPNDKIIISLAKVLDRKFHRIEQRIAIQNMKAARSYIGHSAAVDDGA